MIVRIKATPPASQSNKLKNNKITTTTFFNTLSIMKKTFYDVNEAIAYALSVGAVNLDRFCSYELNGIGRAVTNLGVNLGFDIDGFSNVQPLIYVFHSNNDPEYNEIQHRGFVLDVLGYGVFYLSNMDKGKYGLSSLSLLNAPYQTFEYFRTELVAPQNIGKATKTKILNWCEYAKQLEEEKICYFERRKERRENVLTNILANTDSAHLKTREGEKPFGDWEFQPVVLTYIADNGLKIQWEFDGYGHISRTYGYDYSKAPAFADTLDGGEYKK